MNEEITQSAVRMEQLEKHVGSAKAATEEVSSLPLDAIGKNVIEVFIGDFHLL